MNQKQNVLIDIREVHKTYTDNGVPVKALRGVNLQVEKGEFSALVGPSGSGKTTLLNVLSGLDRATEGEVTLQGRLISDMSGREMSEFRRDHVGLIFQAYNLIPVLTAGENVEYVMLLQGVPKQERIARVSDMLERVGLGGLQNRIPSQLSGGQQQRVAIARAMVSHPSLILADEPTANLDSQTGGQLLDMMRELNRDTGMTFLFSTHDRLVMERARRIVRLHDGRIESDEATDH
jgi:putative ABC transport system ATP-binding protein